MPSIDDVYRKFGFVSEASQLLETQLGNLLIAAGVMDANLLKDPDPAKGRELVTFVNKQTLGQLLRSLRKSIDGLDGLDDSLSRALYARNRLTHSFYRQHNFLRNTDEGRAVMLADLDSIHITILKAYKSVMLLSGVDLDRLVDIDQPTKQVPI